MYPVIRIGTWEIYTYGLFLALGILAAVVLFRVLCAKKKVADNTYNFYATAGIAAIAVGLFSALLYQSVYNWIESGFTDFELKGVTFMGGLIGGVAAFVALTLLWRRPYFKPFDAQKYDAADERAALDALGEGGDPAEREALRAAIARKDNGLIWAQRRYAVSSFFHYKVFGWVDLADLDSAAESAELAALGEGDAERKAELTEEIKRKELLRLRYERRVKNLAAQKDVRKDFWEIAEIGACCILIAHALGRIGCFLGGCCYGIETDGVWGVQFPGHAHKVYPTNLFESGFLFIMFALTLAALLADKPKGCNLIAYALSYAVFRFLLEYIRGDERGAFIPGLTPSQFQSVLLFAVGVGLLIRKILRDRRTARGGSDPDAGRGGTAEPELAEQSAAEAAKS
ncbi:MAG: prolipoprotein diacylglyceryl transferase [Clostridiales bacterium]|jgi:prolipoprotein diacylglyceryltransferase|nr:prolipoprotein diacylglyceryl transferase [Clostridiales bacterium]